MIQNRNFRVSEPTFLVSIVIFLHHRLSHDGSRGLGRDLEHEREAREKRLERERDLLLVSEGFQTANKENKMGYWLPGIMASRVEVIS